MLEVQLKIFISDNCPKCTSSKKAIISIKNQGVPYETFNTDTPEGMAEAAFYSVMSTPTVILEIKKGNVGWTSMVDALGYLKKNNFKTDKE